MYELTDTSPAECCICIFNPDHTCDNCAEKGFKKRVLIPDHGKVLARRLQAEKGGCHAEM